MPREPSRSLPVVGLARRPAGRRSGKAPHLNPQHYLPSLNESLRLALQLGEREGWTTTTVGAMASSVYKGSRFRREELETDDVHNTEARIYYTPAALLQERGERIKLLDLSRADETRKKVLDRHALHRGQLLISRSGTIGRVSMAMAVHEGHLGSGDLIRVEIENEPMRFYAYAFLKSRLGQDQMKRNEYGTIQRLLEPRHVRDIVIPVPDDPELLMAVATPLMDRFGARELSSDLEIDSIDAMAAAFVEGEHSPDIPIEVEL